MNTPYVPVGNVKIENGSVDVRVDPRTGFVVATIEDERGRLAASAVLTPESVLELTKLMARASAIAPSIKAAHEVRMRARATAEDTYDRIVNRAVGGVR
ncbi:hypothetical protein [Mycobacteroides abscessus]|uniref:hypothetical protein n=1 Tax=Mycobacteroides abscessus TaxID=36809 RepID=UPI0009A85C2B|nr:hypothetical protein [Mycobacteroides abscessus]SKS50958.1 Uncharacterised protein [Mycobacteroides abscessus subsp. bolletii]